MNYKLKTCNPNNRFKVRIFNESIGTDGKLKVKSATNHQTSLNENITTIKDESP